MRSLRLVPSRVAVLGSFCALTLGTAAPYAAPCSYLSAAVSYSSGSAPNGIAVGDFDRDGVLDLAIANATGANTFSVLRGKGTAGVGDGTFLAPVGYASAGSVPRSIASADLDEDGVLDMLVGVNNSLQLWKGAANGTFTLRASVAAGSTPRSIAIADLDADGVLDVAVANSAGNEVRLLHGEGTGGVASGALTAWRTIAVGASPVRVLLVDISGDGILDLVTANNTAGSVTLARGRGTAPRGDGTFNAATTLNPGGNPWGLATGDFDEDGRVDLVVTNSGGTVITQYRGTGAGAFVKRGDFTVPLAPQDVVVGDFDGDGIADLASACAGTNQAIVLPGTGMSGVGDGGFGAARTFTVAAGPVCLVAADFKQDGAPDLITGNYSGNSISRLVGLCPTTLPVGLRITSPNGGEPWWPGTTQTVSWTKGAGVLAVDVDLTRDGGTVWEPLVRQCNATSLVVPALTPTSSNVRVRVRDALVPTRSDMSDAPALVCGLLAGAIVSGLGLTGLEHLVTADLDQDGLADLVAAGAAGIELVRGDGAGSFASWLTSLADSVRAVRCADLDGDFRPDVVTLERSAIGVRRVVGGTLAVAMSTPFAAHGMDLVIADFDEDGLTDAAVVGGDAVGGALYVLRGNGDGTFAAPTRLSLPAFGAHVVASDFDADGIVDLAVTAGTSLQLWRGQGSGGRANGAFVLASERALPLPPGNLACGDFDGDQALDLVACLGATGDVWRFRGVAAEHRFEAPTAFGVGSDPREAQVTDLDGDGGSDLVVALGSGSGLVVLTGNGAASLTPGSFDAPLAFAAQAVAVAGSQALALGDFTSDALPDVVTLGADGALTTRPAQCPPMGSAALQFTIIPAAGSAVMPGQEIAIAWTRGVSVPLVNVDLSRDDGAHWQPLAERVAADAWSWTVNGSFTSSARLRVRDAVVPARAATSAAFSIGSGPLDAASGPLTLALGSAWPSPTRGAVTLALRLPRATQVNARVTDLSGRLVRVLDERAYEAGEHVLRWDGADANGASSPAGVYFVVVRGEGFSATRRCVRLR